MSPGATFERVYGALKERLTGGRLVPGDHLEPAALGYELNSSVTPVRDALHRLVGERLVEAARTDGFRVPRIGEKALRHLYAWNAQLLILSGRLGAFHGRALAGPDPAAGIVAPSLVDATEVLFLDLALGSQNAELQLAVASASDRLRPYRLVEGEYLDALPAELEGLEAAARSSDVPRLRRAIAAYHRRRERIVPDLLARLLAPE